MSHKKLIAFIILINYFSLKVFCFVDYNSVQNDYNITQVIYKNIEVKRNYAFKWMGFFDSHLTRPQLVMSLPTQLRLRLMSELPTGVKIDMTDDDASFRIRGVSLMHQGFYTAFKVINSSFNGKSYQYVEERRLFYFNVIGLSKENEICIENMDCESNHCLDNRCVCNGDKPVPIDQICHSAQPIGSKCFHSNQCKAIGGPNSECSSKEKCRCAVGAFSVDLPHYGKYCIRPRILNDDCIYSEECSTIGSNRYCNQQYKCQCIPDYIYRSGIGCIDASNSISAFMPSKYIWPLLVLTSAAYV